MNDFFSWQILATFSGATAATAIVTQGIKDLLKKIPTQLVSYVIGFVLLCGVTAVSELTNWQVWALVPLNALVVSLAANGGYAAIQRVSGDKLK